ncbi:hypothetical protein G7939_12630 [Ralstonia solanacearum]|uniref:hypothetical protein n=1 Tax=Ralstonia pseudosolanacearum TaxID=1310165 RepID=UPI000B5F9C35|nr:hypothetical protein [Ralstonia pseudosolanacearum]QIK24186.1 hypothetical protein G7939_12630 [Ralstonia solanacearum]ASL74290.1 hypothetical protein BC350_12195 [Ralstonia pseudosolanacearum]MCK4117668.1 hypothetical protein [Ralstonia pseudosolanacearum]QIK27778.1 hypothetical protein G7947_05190 [Ralstonia solanacearum]QIK32683.1 hypothetical protein G7969_05190 [Ralstonia solanacearum]
MKNMTCLQYVINGMNDKIFDFAKTKKGKALVAAYKKLIFCREDQAEEFLIAYNSYYMVIAAMQLKGMPNTPKSVVNFMLSEEFEELSEEIRKVVTENDAMLMSFLNRKQKRKLEALFA